MADAGVKETDKILKDLEKKIKKEYRQAGKETEKKLNDFLAQFDKADKAQREALKAGQITKAQYQKWRTTEILMGQRWADMRSELAKDYANATQIAMRMTESTMKDAYAINHNFGTFQAEKGARLNTKYTLYDRNTVDRLIKDTPTLLPRPSTDIPKALRWNNQKITSAITQGILQGEAIPNIAKRLEAVTGMGERAAIRSARTMITAAQNAGRVDSYERAEEMGIEMEQVWLATIDDHTRESHVEMDGEAVPVGEKFSNGLAYPGDPSGDPAEVYNCRCTLIGRVAGVDLEVDNLNERWSDIGNMSYEQWKEGK